MEELLTVAIDDTTNTLFRTGITRFICHNSIFARSFILYSRDCQGSLCNLWVIRILQDVEFLSRSLEPGGILLLNNKTYSTIIPLNKQKYGVHLFSYPINAIITKTRATTVLQPS